MISTLAASQAGAQEGMQAGAQGTRSRGYCSWRRQRGGSADSWGSGPRRNTYLVDFRGSRYKRFGADRKQRSPRPVRPLRGGNARVDAVAVPGLPSRALLQHGVQARRLVGLRLVCFASFSDQLLTSLTMSFSFCRLRNQYIKGRP